MRIGSANVFSSVGQVLFTNSSSILTGNNNLYWDNTNGSLLIAGAVSDTSAVLKLSGTSKGFLPNRLTTAQVSAISSPSEGLFVYNTTTDRLNYYDGSSWLAPAITLQDAYNNTSTQPEITVDSTRGAVSIRDASTPIGANLLEVASFSGASTYFRANTAGIAVAGGGSIDVLSAGSLTIGSTVGANNLTLGSSSSTVVVSGNLQVNGTTTTINSTTTTIADPNIVLNRGGAANSGTLSGIFIEENSVEDQGYMRSASDRTNLEFKAPGGSILTLDMNSDATLTMTANLTVSGTSLINQDVRTTASPTFVNATLSGKTVGSVLFAGTGGVITEDTSNFVWDDTNNTLLIGDNTTDTVASFEITSTTKGMYTPRMTGTQRDAITVGGSQDGLFLYNTTTKRINWYTGTAWVSPAVTLQDGYNNSTSPELTLDSTRGAVTIRDNSTPIAAPLFEIQNNAGGTTYFSVDTSDTTMASAIVSDLTATRVVFAGTAGALVDDADLTFTTGTNTLNATNATVSTDLRNSSLTATRVVFAGSGGLLTDDADMTFSTGTNTLTVTNATVSTSLTVSSLTSTRVPFATTAGLLTDDADLTFTTGTNTLSSGNVTVTSLTPTRVVFAGTGGALVDDADMTFSTGSNTLTVTNATVSTTMTVSSLTSGRVTFAGLGGALTDDSDLTFSGSTLTATNATVSTLLTWSAGTTGSVLFIGAAGAVTQDNANFFWDDTNNTLLIGDNTTDTSAMFELTSTTKGMYTSRMNTTQRNAITVGAAQEGLLLFNTQTDRFNFYEATTASWKQLVVDLQDAYDNSTSPEIVLDSTRGAVTIRDNATPIAANLFEVQNNAGTTSYFKVESSGATVTGKLTVTGLIDPTGIVFDEQSSVPGGAPAAGKGTVWIKNDTPNVLYFTDDTNVNYNISLPASSRRRILQTAHGFVSGTDIGAAIYLNASGDWVKAQADAAGTLGVALISKVIDANNFELITHGYMTGINVVTLTPYEYHFVSTTTAGELTDTEPTTNGDYSNPILLADSTSSGWVYAFRPNVINTATISTSFTSAFDNTSTGTPVDFTAPILTVTHNLNQQYNHVVIYDDSGTIISPDSVVATSTTVCTVDLSSFTVGATAWHVTIST